ncbi:hypothetical protein AAG906_035534 [Vitis piasezkii]
MDAVLQIFKRSICPGTPFFESLAKKPPTTMDDLFRRANKYSMLEDDVRAATQQVLVAGRASRGDAERHAKPPDRPKPVDRRQEGPSRPDRPPLTPLSVSYEKLLPMIQGSTDLVQASVVGHMGHGLAGLENPGRILSGFNGSSTTSLRDIVLPVQAGPVTLNVQFSVVQELSPFNVILGRTWLHYMKAIPSTYHQMVSFLTNEGQTDLYGSQLAARQCYQIAREAGTSQEDQLLGPADKDPPAADPLQTIQILEENNHLTNISSLMTQEETQSMQNILRSNHDIFAWTHSDMKGIHPLLPLTSSTFSDFGPSDRRSTLSSGRTKVIRKEIDKLLEARFIEKCLIQLVGKRSSGMLSFLDAFSGYHQIPMSPDDEEKTAFITPHDLYCYKVMPFGLKIWRHLSKINDRIFKPAIGHTVRCILTIS